MGCARTVFFLSDRTGLTAETLGQSLLAQFDDLQYTPVSIPFIQTREAAQDVVRLIDQAAAEDGVKPIVFCTLVDDAIVDLLETSAGMMVDLFGTFVGPLEQTLEQRSLHRAGRSHSVANSRHYNARIEAMNFAMDNDDGTAQDYASADVILIGVSRCGKTPTCLYLALQFGLRAANYPLVEEDLRAKTLPEALRPHRRKLYGLTIDAERLVHIRQTRRPDSTYASPAQCRWELDAAMRLMRDDRIPHIDSTSRSIEEIAATILHETGVRRRFF